MLPLARVLEQKNLLSRNSSHLFSLCVVLTCSFPSRHGVFHDEGSWRNGVGIQTCKLVSALDICLLHMFIANTEKYSSRSWVVF